MLIILITYIYFAIRYYIKYDEQLFNSFEKKQFVRNYRDGKDDKPQEHIFIPIEHLIKIN